MKHKRFSTLVREAKQMRITRDKLRQRIERLQHAGFDIEIGWAYGQPRVTNKSESRDLSPRLPMSAMNEWIDGFESGVAQQCIKQSKTIKYALQYISKGIADKAFDGCVIDPDFVVKQLEQLL